MNPTFKQAALSWFRAAAAAAAYAGKLAIDGVKAAIADEAAQNRLANALKNVTQIETTFESYTSCVFVSDTDQTVSAYYRSGFDLLNNDTVLISGLSTSINNLSGSKSVGFTTETVGLAITMSSYSSTPGGKSEDIFVTTRPTVSIGGSILIKSNLGTEIVKVLNDYSNELDKRFKDRHYVSVAVGREYGKWNEQKRY